MFASLAKLRHTYHTYATDLVIQLRAHKLCITLFAFTHTIKQSRRTNSRMIAILITGIFPTTPQTNDP